MEYIAKERPKCAICGKRLYAFQYNLNEYAYKKGSKYYCCYSHMRKAVLEKQERDASRTGKNKIKNIILRG